MRKCSVFPRNRRKVSVAAAEWMGQGWSGLRSESYPESGLEGLVGWGRVDSVPRARGLLERLAGLRSALKALWSKGEESRRHQSRIQEIKEKANVIMLVTNEGVWDLRKRSALGTRWREL